MELSFNQLFGSNASQNITSITIQKSDLPGLTASTSNTAESLLAGILLKMLENFEGKLQTETGDVITDEFGIPITFNQGDIFGNIYLFNWRIIIRRRNNTQYCIIQIVYQEFELYE